MPSRAGVARPPPSAPSAPSPAAPAERAATSRNHSISRARPGPPSTVRVSGTANAGVWGAGVRDSVRVSCGRAVDRDEPVRGGLEPVEQRAPRRAAGVRRDRRLGRTAARRPRSPPGTGRRTGARGRRTPRTSVTVDGSSAARRHALRHVADVQAAETGQRIDHGLGRLEVRQRLDADHVEALHAGGREDAHRRERRRPRPAGKAAVRMDRRRQVRQVPAEEGDRSPTPPGSGPSRRTGRTTLRRAQDAGHGGRHAQPQQREHHRVGEGVIVVVGQARDDRRPGSVRRP